MQKRKSIHLRPVHQSGIADSASSIVGQPIEESARLESSKVEVRDRVQLVRIITVLAG
jgi:hypothetical protein